MSATAAQRLEFAPHQPPGMWRAFALALLAHTLLLAALSWGVTWRKDTPIQAVEAELWAAVPQQAAPPPPPPEPVAEPEPVPPPPEPVAAPVVEAPDPQIALERERDKKREKIKAQQELEREHQVKLERDKAKKAAEEKRHEQELARRQEADKKALAAAKLKQEQAAKAKLDLAAKTKQELAAAKALEKQRQENLQRLTGLAGASGASTSTGTAAKSAGPSASYGARIAARIKPNIVFTEEIAGNPTADVEVRSAPDGTIVGRKLIKSSGNSAWDEAVLKAIDKTERLPRDVDGRVQPSLVIGFRPRD
jgi:colicin import membrane protein